MTMYKHPETGQILTSSAAVEIDGIKHPPGWLNRQPPGKLKKLGFVEYEPTYTAPVITHGEVTMERDRRMRAGVKYKGHIFDSDETSMLRITAANVLAARWIDSGGDPKTLKWYDEKTQFKWITADNTVVPMSASDILELGAAASEHERAHIFAARALKDNEVIPSDYTDDKYWPKSAR